MTSKLVNWLWHVRYWFYRVSGATRRFLRIDHKETFTLGEIMSELERSPEMRKHLDDAREKLKITRRHW